MLKLNVLFNQHWIHHNRLQISSHTPKVFGITNMLSNNKFPIMYGFMKCKNQLIIRILLLRSNFFNKCNNFILYWFWLLLFVYQIFNSTASLVNNFNTSHCSSPILQSFVFYLKILQQNSISFFHKKQRKSCKQSTDHGI